MAKLQKVWSFGLPYDHEELVSEGTDHIGGVQYSSHVVHLEGDEGMKVSGMSKTEWLQVAGDVDSALQWKSMADGPGSFEGYFSYKVHSPTPWKLKASNGAVIHKPCGHIIVAIVSRAMDYAKLHGLQPVIWAAKLKFVALTPVSHYKTLQTKINGEYTCVCQTEGKFPGVYDPNVNKAESPLDLSQKAPEPAAPIYAKAKATKWADEIFVSKPTVEKISAPKLALEYEPVKADPIMDGETEHIPSEKRKVEVATAGLYIMEEIFAGVMAAPRNLHRGQWRNTQDLRRIEFISRFRKVHSEYGSRLARNFFDYLTIACFGEARYKDGGLYALHAKGGKQQGRAVAYQTALHYDPRHLLPVMEQVFGRVNWGGGYGGPKWSFIAKQAQWYFKLAMAPVAFADHVVDLAHNGGLAFNKGYIINNPKDQATYMEMLTVKRNGYLTRDWTKSLDVPEEVYRIMVEAVSLGFIQAPTANIWPAQDVKVPTLKWGSEKLKAEFLTPPTPLAQYMEKMEQEVESKKVNPSKGFKVPSVPGHSTVKAKLLEAR